MMKQLSFFKFATVGLLVLNVSMVAFFLLSKPHPPRQGKGGPPHRGAPHHKKAPEVLQLDEQQEDVFFEFRDQHAQRMRSLDDQQRELLTPYFYSLIDSTEMIDSDALLLKVQQVERKKVEATYRHFQEVKSILRTDQHSDFEVFVDFALKRILFGGKKNHPPPRDF